MNGFAGEDELLDAERNRAQRQRMTIPKLSGSDIGVSEAA
jgi:hypothetical protein